MRVVLTRIRATLDQLVLVEAVWRVLVLMCLRLHPLMEATEEVLFCIGGRITAAVAVVLRVLRVHTARLPKAEVEAQLRQQAAATALLLQPRHKQNRVWRIQVAVEVAVKMRSVGMREQRVVQA